MGKILSDFWNSLSIDRVLSIVALVVGIVAILRVEWLFEKLYKREKYIKQAML